MFLVMAGLVPAIHVFLASGTKDVDARHKAGHGELNIRCSDCYYPAAAFFGATLTASLP